MHHDKPRMAINTTLLRMKADPTVKVLNDTEFKILPNFNGTFQSDDTGSVANMFFAADHGDEKVVSESFFKP